MEWLAVKAVLEPTCLGLVIGLFLGGEILYILKQIDLTLDRRQEKHAERRSVSRTAAKSSTSTGVR